MLRICLCLLLTLSASGAARVQPKVKDAWQPQAAKEVGGVLGERLELWREHQLWRKINDPFLLEGFESPPGKHLWQGEHVGKWLHAATLAYEATHDEKLLRKLQDTVHRLVAAQQPNGYLGTYSPEMRFYAPPGEHTRRSWDIWTHRYNIYGLLTYDRFHPDPAAVRACVRMGDLLLDTFGPGKRDMTHQGTRWGMSSGTLLESMVMLYERTGEARFLDFARHIVRMSEDNPKFRLLSAMLAHQDVSGPGDGKAYQLMAVLLGYGELYRQTGEAQWIKGVVNGWENIRAGHLYVTGGPWSYKSTPAKNQECFAPPEFFDPAHAVVEVCSVTTWVQLSLQLLRITGEARYASEAERAVLNQVIGSQSPDGIAWSTHPPANTPDRKYVDSMSCCASSGPRALELFATHLVGIAGEAVSIASYLPATVTIPDRRLKLTIRGDYPFASRASVVFEMAKPASFPVDFALPSGAKALRVEVNGKAQKARHQTSGFYRVWRTWSPGTRIEVVFDFPVTAHVQHGRGGRRWVAFTRGPIVLAAERSFEFPDARDASALIEGEGERIRIKGGPHLAPYYRVGSPRGPVVTYFPVK